MRLSAICHTPAKSHFEVMNKKNVPSHFLKINHIKKYNLWKISYTKSESISMKIY
jgi:hypothetical protein